MDELERKQKNREDKKEYGLTCGEMERMFDKRKSDINEEMVRTIYYKYFREFEFVEGSFMRENIFNIMLLLKKMI